MKVSGIKLSSLKRVLAAVKPAVATHTTVPTLKCCKIVAGLEGVHVSATNLELFATASLFGSGISINEGGSTAVSHDLLSRAVATLPEQGDYSLLADGNLVTLRAGSHRHNIPSLDVNEFPDSVLAEGERAKTFEISAADLHRLIVATSFAASNTVQLHSTEGVLFELSGDKLSAFATDTKRLSFIAHDVQVETKDSENVRKIIAPLRFIRLFTGAYASNEEMLKVTIGNSITIQSPTMMISSPGMSYSGKSIDYREVLKNSRKKTQGKLTTTTDALRDVCEQALVYKTPEYQRVDFSFSDEQLHASCRSPVGEMDSPFCDSTYEGKPLKTAFDPDYLRQYCNAVDSMGGAEITVFVAPNGGATVLEAAGIDSFLHLAMGLVGD